MSTHHKVFKIVLITGTLSILTAIWQWTPDKQTDNEETE